ncbi:MAG: KAP family NTPase [Micrococcales bacterium]|nr:KAP family NTPase [Micrococcales bacterium]MCL2666911.1 KAP family NTPase [Micrococcales bacterium]
MGEPARRPDLPERAEIGAADLSAAVSRSARAAMSARGACFHMVSDEPAKQDGLGRDDLASHIATVIQMRPPPFTIAVYGGWGEGKTSLLHQIQRKVDDRCDEGGPTACHTVWFDLWEHQDDINPVLAMLALARAEQDRTSTLLQTAVDKLDKVTPLLWAALDQAGHGVFSGYQRRSEALRKDRMAVVDAQVQLRNHFAQALDALAGEGRLVFFVDDLDRCLPENVVNLLEKIRLFMNHEKCVFVLAVDDQAVERAVQQVKQYEDPQVAGRYLEKMIQYAFDLPPAEKSQRTEFVMTALRKAADDSLQDEAIHTIVQDLWRLAFDDPQVDASIRLVLRTVNTFAVDHAIASAKLGDDYDPRIMAVISALKTCYREAFTQLRRRHDDRTRKFWRFFFAHDADRGKESSLGVLFCRTGARWKDQPDEKEPDGEDRSGWAFVQAAQILYSGDEAHIPRRSGFSELVENHFRFAAAPAPRETEPEEQPERTPKLEALPGGTNGAPGPASVSSDPVEPGDHLVSEADTGSGARTPLRPAPRRRRLGGLVDYWTRDPSTEEDVQEECANVLLSAVVRLSGVDWRVLEVRSEGSDRQALLLADRVIGTGPYNKADIRTSWARCDLRRWLNEEFADSLGKPLTDRVLRRKVHNGPNPVWDTDGGEDTTDQFFLLSMEDAAGYFTDEVPSDWKAYRKLKRFALGVHGIAKNEEGESSWWWLRSSGRSPVYCAGVSRDGDVRDSGFLVSSSWAVRPAFWLNLEP